MQRRIFKGKRCSSGWWKKVISDREELILSISLELGISAHEVKAWAEADLQAYLRYFEKYGYPSQRLESYLAQISYYIFQSTYTGKRRYKITDFQLPRILNAKATPKAADEPPKIITHFLGGDGSLTKKRKKKPIDKK